MENNQVNMGNVILNRKIDNFIDKSHYLLIIYVSLISTALFGLVLMFQDYFSDMMSIAAYLTWHNIFEFTAILVCISVFFVSYYTYDQTRGLRMLVLGCVFLVVALLDAFHTLSFKGMPDFFIENTSANRATTFWIISRLFAGVGFIASRLIDIETKAEVNKRIFLAAAVTFSILCFIVVTYYPQVFPPMFIDGVGLTQTKKNMEYIIILMYAITVVLALREYGKTKNRLTLWFSVAVLISIFSELAFVTYVSVYDVFNYLGHIYKFIAFFIIFRIMYIHSIQKPYMELTRARNELKLHAENLDRLVDARTKELKQMNSKLMEDLEYARDIQKAMLPSVLPEEQEVSFDARYYPAERVSGDFYNIFKLDDQHIGLYIGDVSGHGVSAAMLTVFLNQSIKVTREEECCNFEILKPSEVLKNIYKSFNRTNFKDDVYMVLLYGIYNIKTREFTYSSAGMNVAPIIINREGKSDVVDINGFPICKFMEFYTVDYSDSTIRLNSGDRVFFYTDGLTEARNRDGQHYSEKRIRNLLERSCNTANSSLSEHIAKDVFEFIGENKLHDDITYFIMQIK